MLHIYDTIIIIVIFFWHYSRAARLYFEQTVLELSRFASGGDFIVN